MSPPGPAPEYREREDGRAEVLDRRGFVIYCGPKHHAQALLNARARQTNAKFLAANPDPGALDRAIHRSPA